MCEMTELSLESLKPPLTGGQKKVSTHKTERANRYGQA